MSEDTYTRSDPALDRALEDYDTARAAWRTLYALERDLDSVLECSEGIPLSDADRKTLQRARGVASRAMQDSMTRSEKARAVLVNEETMTRAEANRRFGWESEGE